MKKLFGAITVLMITVTTVLADPSPSVNGTTNEKKKELRQEKRKERRTLWAHSVFPATEIQFGDDFPNAKDVTWTVGEFVEATFIDNGTVKTAYYDSDNELVGTTTDVAVSDLPLKAQEYIQKKYPQYTIQKIVFFDDNEENDTDMFIYKQAVEDKDNYFPVLSNGKKEIILKVSTEGEVSFFENYK